MMKKLTLIACLFLLHHLSAQITINQSHMPKSGDTAQFSTAIPDTAVLFNYQNSGANLTWDFDSLIPTRQGVRRFFGSNQTPYSSMVSNRIGEKLADTLNIAGFEVFDVFDFFKSDSTGYLLDHRGISAPTGLSFPFPATISVAPSFSDKDEVYQFPLDYLDRDSSTFKVVYNNLSFGVYYESSGERINNVDAWGTLITPYDTFNTIRVVTDIMSYDTISFAGNDVGLNSHQREYKWLSTELNIPALTISGPVISGVFAPANVQFRDTTRNLPSILAPIAIFIADDFFPAIGDTVNFFNLSVSLLKANYKWEITPSTFSYVNGTSSTTDSLAVVFNDTGLYDVQLIANNSDGSDTLLFEDYIEVSQITSLNEIKSDANSKVRIFPNPATGGNNLTILLSEGLFVQDVSLFDSKGRLVDQLNQFNKGSIMQLELPKVSGIYLLRMNTNEGLVTKTLLLK